MTHYHNNSVTKTEMSSIGVIQTYCTTCGSSRFEKDGKAISFDEVRALDPSQWDEAAVEFHRTHKPLEE